MIISASRRTDIPAFYSDWFFNRIKEGFVRVRNPMNVHQVSEIDLNPEIVDCIVFWTRNPKYMINRLDILKDYTYYFQFTITGYGRTLEPNVPPIENSIRYFKMLSDKIGPKSVIWRYDPIIMTDKQDINFHVDQFGKISGKLTGYTNRCVISFVDFYKKTIRNLENINYKKFSQVHISRISKQISKIANSQGMNIVSCAEEYDLTRFGIDRGKCIDDKIISEISGYAYDIIKDKNQRAECGCVASIDIGAYNTCPQNCLYCYANYNHQKVVENYKKHDPNSTLLLGQLNKDDKVVRRKVISCKIMQETLFREKSNK